MLGNTNKQTLVKTFADLDYFDIETNWSLFVENVGNFGSAHKRCMNIISFSFFNWAHNFSFTDTKWIKMNDWLLEWLMYKNWGLLTAHAFNFRQFEPKEIELIENDYWLFAPVHCPWIMFITFETHDMMILDSCPWFFNSKYWS